MEASTATKTRAKNGSPVGPCGDCKTRFGRVLKGKLSPARILAERFGFSDPLCHGCYGKHASKERRAAERDRANAKAEKEFSAQAETVNRYLQVLSSRSRLANSCDLCGVHSGERFDGGEFGIEGERGGIGRICAQCRDELRQERAVRRQAKLANLAIKNRIGSRNMPSRVYHLPVLNPRFEEADLTSRAGCRLMIAAAKKRSGRTPKIATPPADPCISCGTTEGKLGSTGAKHARFDGSKFGAPGLHCGACYDRLYNPRRTINLIGGAA